MLSQTKEQMQDLVGKIQLLEFTIASLKEAHKDQHDRVESLYKQATNHKLVLVEELLRLSNAIKLEEVK